MTTHLPTAGRVALGLATAALVLAGAIAPAAGAQTTVSVLASGLNQPKKITLTADGDLVVALSGDGDAPASCTDGGEASCAGDSGAVDEVSRQGAVTTLRSELPSVSAGGDDAQATGPAEARLVGRRLEILFQDSTISQTTGAEIFGSVGSLLGDLVGYTSSTSAGTVQAAFGAFEARANPDHGAGTDVLYGEDAAIASDPYSFVAYRGGYAVADAGANDVLFVSRTGAISVLAVLPTISEPAAAGTFGADQTTAITAQAQAVPVAVAVGPDGALYVGELGGEPFEPGSSVVYRIGPHGRLTAYARGFTAIEDIAFDAQGRLLVLEIDQKGLDDPGFDTGSPASGAIIRVSRSGRRMTLLDTGLSYPTGLAVGRDGVLYVTNDGVSSASTGTGGEILQVRAG